MSAQELEFWPDYGGALLWSSDGAAVPLDQLPLSADLRTRLEDWVSRYDDSLLPMEEPGNAGWLDEGTRLLDEVRSSLSPTYDVVVTEPWWGSEGVK